MWWHRVSKIDRLIKLIHTNQEEIMAAIDDLNAAVAAQQAENTVIVTTLGTVAQQITALQAQVASLQAQIAAGNTDDPQVEADAKAIQDGLATVQAAIAAVTPAPAPVPAPTTSYDGEAK